MFNYSLTLSINRINIIKFYLVKYPRKLRAY